METAPPVQQESLDHMNAYAADLLVNKTRTAEDVIELLKEKGLSHETASGIVFDLQDQINSAKKSAANKDMLYGALWCVGGLILTFTDTGFIFWGAIIFGAIQFFKGVANS
jgi:hypothetical protein